MTTKNSEISFDLEILGNVLNDYKIFEDRADEARLNHLKTIHLNVAIRTLENYKRTSYPGHYNIFIESIINPEIIFAISKQ